MDNDDDDWVRGLGIYGSAHLMAGGSVGKMVYWDDKGNIAIVNTYELGATTDIEATIGGSYEWSSSVNSVADMSGKSLVVGGGVDVWGVGVASSHSISTIDNLATSNTISVYGGPGINPIGGGISMSYSQPVLQFNPEKWVENFLGIK